MRIVKDSKPRHSTIKPNKSWALWVTAPFMVSTLAVGSVVSPSLATAVDDSGCDDGDPNTSAQDVGGGVCELRFTSDVNWVVPAGLTSLEALLVGAGGAAARDNVSVGGDYSYGGGGGEVKIVNLATDGGSTIEITVGQGATSDMVLRGGTTVISQGVSRFDAEGGESALAGYSGRGGASGSGSVGGSSVWLGSTAGGGAGGSNDGRNGGPGVNVADIAGSGLFSGLQECFGGGGATSYPAGTSNDPVTTFDGSTENGAATCGGGYVYFDLGDFPTTLTNSRAVAPAANKGGGGGVAEANNSGGVDPAPWVDLGDAQSGADGLAVIRYSFTDRQSQVSASGSPVPVARLEIVDGKTISPGGLVQFYGTGLHEIVGARIDGKNMAIVSRGAGSLSFRVPKNLRAGTFTSEFLGSTGNVLQTNQLLVPKQQIKRLVPGFAGNSPIMTKEVKKAILVATNRLPGAVNLVCTGSTSNTRVTAFDKRLAKDRATRACARAKTLNPELTTQIRIAPASGIGPRARNVKMVLRNY